MTTAKDYMLCWNPHSDQVALVRWPDTSGRSRPYLCTHLACWSGFHKLSFEDRKKLIFVEAYHLIVADGCDPAAVHRALWPLDEYQAGLAEDFPAPSAPLRWSSYRRTGHAPERANSRGERSESAA